MRCKACDVILTSFEATRYDVETEDYVDLCNKCFAWTADVGVVVEREDLKTLADVEESLLEYQQEQEDDFS